MIAFLKRFFLSPEGKASLTKAGTTIAALTGTAASLHLLEVIVLPKGLFAACVVIAITGGKMTVDGLRDAKMKK